MLRPLFLAWRQLDAQRLRFLMALAGVGFAVVLMLMQLGFRRAMFDGSVRVHAVLRADVVLINPQSRYLVMMRSFPRRRLDQALAAPGVVAVRSVYAGFPFWDAGDNEAARTILALGFDPQESALDLPEVDAQLWRIRNSDQALFDRKSRTQFGPIAQAVERDGSVDCELNDQRYRIVGLYDLGVSFGVDGSMIMSDEGFLRMFPGRSAGVIEIGLVRVRPGADPIAVRNYLRETLPRDVEALTRAEFVQREKAYWNDVTPVGYVFFFGVLLGFGVGAVIVAQILFADVTDHLAEYATLKAIGSGDRFLYALVLGQALILGFLGFVPGLLLSLVLYAVSANATGLPMVLDASRAVLVLALTVAMCALSGAAALRKVQKAEPAEIF